MLNPKGSFGDVKSRVSNRIRRCAVRRCGFIARVPPAISGCAARVSARFGASLVRPLRSLVRPVRSRWPCAEGANANPHASLDVTPYRETFPITTDRFERWIVTVYRASRSERRGAHTLAKT